MSNSTEDVKAVINKILGYNMKGGDDSDSDSSSSSSSSSISSSFEINNVNDDIKNIDSDDNVSSEQTEKNLNPASRPSKLSSSNSSDSDSKSEEKTESEFDNLTSSSSGGSSSESLTDSVYKEKEDYKSKRTSEIPDATKVTKDIEDLPINKQKQIMPDNLVTYVSSRMTPDALQGLQRAIHQKFPHLTDTEKGNCETKIVMRHILREVNKQNDFGDDQDALIKAAYKYLDNMTESDINIEKFSEIDKAKDMSKKLFINMLYKIHKLAPELSHGDPRDGNVYDTIIVRSAAYRVAHEKYPDLPRLEFNQKVFDMLTPKFIKSVNIEEEKQRYEEYKNNKENNDSKPKAKKSTTKTKKSKK